MTDQKLFSFVTFKEELNQSLFLEKLPPEQDSILQKLKSNSLFRLNLQKPQQKVERQFNKDQDWIKEINPSLFQQISCNWREDSKAIESTTSSGKQKKYDTRQFGRKKHINKLPRLPTNKTKELSSSISNHSALANLSKKRTFYEWIKDEDNKDRQSDHKHDCMTQKLSVSTVYSAADIQKMNQTSAKIKGFPECSFQVRQFLRATYQSRLEKESSSKTNWHRVDRNISKSVSKPTVCADSANTDSHVPQKLIRNISRTRKQPPCVKQTTKIDKCFKLRS